jgi:hypothetical protein
MYTLTIYGHELGRKEQKITHAAFSTLGTKLAENLVKWTDLSVMCKFGMSQEKKTPSILNLNLIHLGDLSSPSTGAFSQEEIKFGFFLTAVFIRLRNRVESFFAYPKSPRGHATFELM